LAATAARRRWRQAIRRRRLDVALAPNHMLPARLAKLRAFRERLIAAVPDGHPLARHEKALTWAGLSGETILVQGWDDSQAERQFLAPFLGGEVSFSSHAASRQSILALVAANFGIAMVTESQAAAGFP
jgi:DNA-binding transcriptional LysR family regulator